MNTVRLLFISVLLVGFPGWSESRAQSRSPGGSVSGYVRDTTGRGIPHCTVSLLRYSDTTELCGTTSDTCGFFRLTYPHSGRYLIRYEHLAYRSSIRSADLPVVGPLIDTLTPWTEHIDEVVVLAQYTKYSAGKLTVSMAGNPIAKNRSVSSALDLLPGVRTDGASLFLYGKPVSLVYINGRKSSVEELRSVLAENVDEIELEKHSGSAHDAMLDGGIVRVRLRKQPSGSFYGNVSAGADFSPYLQYYNVPFAFSGQYGNLNIYNYFLSAYGDGDREVSAYGEYRTEGSRLDARTRGSGCNYQIGDLLSLVYELAPNQQVGVLGSYEWKNQPTVSSRQISTLTPLSGFPSPDQPSARQTVYDMSGRSFTRTRKAAATYRYDFDTLGSRFAVQAEYVGRSQGIHADYTTHLFRIPSAGSPYSTEFQHEDYMPDISAFQFRADYTKSFREHRTLTAGVSYEYEDIDNDSEMREFVSGAWRRDEDQSVWFRNRTQKTGAYADYSDVYGKFSLRAGLRFQWDRLSYKSSESAPTTDRDYCRWFPELILSYAFNENRGTFMDLCFMSYSGPLPSGKSILPKRTRTSQYSYTIGNPALRPERYWSVDLTYTLRGKLSFWYCYARATATQEDFTFYDPDDPTVIFTMPMNMGTSHYHTLLVDYDTDITEWLRLGASAEGKYIKENYELDGAKYSFSSKRAQFFCNLILQPVETLRFDLSYNIRTRQQWSAEKSLNADHTLTGSVQKSFFKNRLLLRFTYAGILYTTACFTTEMSDGSYYATERELAPSRRSWRFGLTWRFNHNASKNVKTVSSGLNASSML